MKHFDRVHHTPPSFELKWKNQRSFSFSRCFCLQYVGLSQVPVEVLTLPVHHLDRVRRDILIRTPGHIRQVRPARLVRQDRDLRDQDRPDRDQDQDRRDQVHQYPYLLQALRVILFLLRKLRQQHLPWQR